MINITGNKAFQNTFNSVYGIIYQGARYNCEDLLNNLSAMEGTKVDQAIADLMRISQHGINYSGEDFDVLSYALSLLSW